MFLFTHVANIRRLPMCDMFIYVGNIQCVLGEVQCLGRSLQEVGYDAKHRGTLAASLFGCLSLSPGSVRCFWHWLKMPEGRGSLHLSSLQTSSHSSLSFKINPPYLPQTVSVSSKASGMTYRSLICPLPRSNKLSVVFT